MQNIESILKEFGLEIPAEQAAAFQAKFRDNYKTVKEVEKIEAARDDWKERAETAEGVLGQLPKDVDPATFPQLLKDAQDGVEAAKKDYEQKLAERDFDDALKTALEGVKFTSEAAKRDVAGQVKAAGLKVVDGKIMGLNDLLASIREKDATAFVDEKQQELENNKAQFTKLTVTEGKLDVANSYKYRLGDHADDVAYGQNVQNWKAWDGSAEIDAATGQTLTLVECDKEYKAVAVGSCTVTAKAGE